MLNIPAKKENLAMYKKVLTLLLSIFFCATLPALATETSLQIDRQLEVTNDYTSATLYEVCDYEGCVYWAPLEISNFDAEADIWAINSLHCNLNDGDYDSSHYVLIGNVPYVAVSQCEYCGEYYQGEEPPEWYYFRNKCKFVFTGYDVAQ